MLTDVKLSPHLMQSILDALSAHIAVLDQHGVIVAVNRAWRDFGAANGLTDSDCYLGACYLEHCVRASGEDAEYGRAAAEGIGALLGSRRPYFELEYPCHSPQEQRWFMLRASRFESDGRNWIVLAHDNITERRLAELHQERLTRELSHRVKNMLAVIRSISAQTLSGSTSLEQFAEAFEARLAALSRAEALLTRAWQGLSLRRVVEAALEPYRTPNDRSVELNGPELELTATACLTLSIVLNELATNAAKYGALSVAGGRVRIDWRTEPSSEGPRLHLAWREANGPRVQPAKRRGFGTNMIERSVSYELGGSARLDFPPSGVRCQLAIPLSAAT